MPPKGEVKEISKRNITNILINAAGDVMINEEQIVVSEISRKVRQMLDENDKMAFSVKTLKATKYDVYIDVLDQLKRANATRISIAEPD